MKLEIQTIASELRDAAGLTMHPEKLYELAERLEQIADYLTECEGCEHLEEQSQVDD